jgi:hypothetical protein
MHCTACTDVAQIEMRPPQSADEDVTGNDDNVLRLLQIVDNHIDKCI